VAKNCKESGGKAAEVLEADLTSDVGVDRVRQCTLTPKLDREVVTLLPKSGHAVVP
jgi:hypothetical protein